jgi:hypothetical protein
MTPNQRKLEHYQAANLDAAAIILADRVKYPAGSLMLAWASRVLDRLPEAGRKMENDRPWWTPRFETDREGGWRIAAADIADKRLGVKSNRLSPPDWARWGDRRPGRRWGSRPTRLCPRVSLARGASEF